VALSRCHRAPARASLSSAKAARREC
jgi:hypothetical protein